MKRVLQTLTILGCVFLLPTISMSENTEDNLRSKAQSMYQAAKGNLSPVYEPLAEWIVKTYGLNEKQGIGIDLGSGPGSLPILLCEKTQMHWINADINPYMFPLFFSEGEKAGAGGRISAIVADAHDLPFRDRYADMIVSRGSFHFWKDKPKAFGEIYRVLKPGGVAFIGRGFSENLDVEVARRIRSKQNMKRGVLNYDLHETELELTKIMEQLGVKSYTIIKPKPQNSDDVKYGIWIEIRKSEE